MPADMVRDAAIDVLLRVFERNIPLDESLDKTLRRRPVSDRGRRFMTALAYGTVRHRALCDHALRRICTQPLEQLPAPILVILRMGIFQSLFLKEVTHPAMVHTSVDLARKRGHAGTARLVNAVLRRAPHSLEELPLPHPASDLRAYLSLRYSLPRWMIDQWIAEFGEERAAEFAECLVKEAPLSIRVNTTRTTVSELQRRLEKCGFATEKRTPLPEELTLPGAGPGLFRSVPYKEGLFMAQDPASMLAALLLDPQPGERILDLCAAPGGKTTHIAQRMRDTGVILACDPAFRRLDRVRENADRLGFRAIRPVCAEGTRPPLRSGFDRVLVDAPCSGLGTLRRHPDIKWRLQPEAIARLAAQQDALLRSALECCAPGGVVVYSVCTFGRQETFDRVQRIVKDGLASPEDGPEFLATWQIEKGQYQTLPGGAGWDAFFLTRFRKAS
jgi:16S rRNA (cytosine967-C5)-methyltransferase